MRPLFRDRKIYSQTAMPWLEIIHTLYSSPLSEYLSDEELIDLAVFIRDSYLG